MADTKNLCAQIPIDLHRQVREHQEESGKSLGEYMTWLITTFYQTEVEKRMSSTETRTVAFQVPADIFEEFKDYLDRHHVKQKAFFLDCIQRALADEAERPHEVSTDVDEEEENRGGFCQYGCNSSSFNSHFGHTKLSEDQHII